MVNTKDFLIENGVLKQYTGSGDEVIVPYGVTMIDRNAFPNGASIKKVTLPPTITEIADGAFDRCIDLTCVVVESDVDAADYAGEAEIVPWVWCQSFLSTTACRYRRPLNDDQEEYFGWIYKMESERERLLIHNNAVCSESGTLLRLIPVHIESYTIAKRITEIAPFSFYNHNLIHVTIPDSVTYVNMFAFRKCANLRSVTLDGNNAAVFQHDAFCQCDRLLQKNEDGFVMIGSALYRYRGDADDLIIPDGVTLICRGAFADNQKLESVFIPGSVKEIDTHAFSYCARLRKVTISSSATRIDSQAFFWCSHLKEVTVPKNLLEYGEI